MEIKISKDYSKPQKMKLLNLLKFKRKMKISEKDQKLLEDYEKGKYLRVDEDIDNKKLMLEK